MATITLSIPDELAEHLRERAEAIGQDVNTYILAVLARAAEDEDKETVREIAEALAEMKEAEARGDFGLTIDAAFAELEKRAEQRTQAHTREAATTTA